MKHLAYIFDLDGTLCDCSHRLLFIQPPANLPVSFPSGNVEGWKPDYDSFYAACKDDKPIEDVCKVCRGLSSGRIIFIFVTGRPEKVRQQTTDWLENQDLYLDDYDIVFMRQDGDHRPDYKVKREIYEQKIKDEYEVIGVFEDRQQCVDMWRSLGLTCFQCAKGNY